MSKVPQDPPNDWLIANGFILQDVPCMKEDARLALRASYEADIRGHQDKSNGPFCDLVELIDPPAPEAFTDILPDYSILPPGVEPGSPEHAEYERFLDRYYGYDQSSNPEIAA